MRDKYCNVVYMIKVFALCIAFCLIIIFLDLAYNAIFDNLHMQVFEEIDSPKIIIDAGHGGRDGGALSKSGITEKSLNLSVANTLNDVLKLCGISTIMTRENDSLVCDENNPDLKGKIKITDLKNRLNIANEHPNAIFVSVHMNNFSIEKYKGLQVYYSPNNEKSFILAKSIQDGVCKVLQTENNRKVKKAGSGIFLLDRLQMPAILIECGFLSNIKEAEMLTKPAYQASLSLVFADSLLANLT